MPKKVCSFCGRTEKEVKLLITGINGYICENCAIQAYEIAQSTGLLEPQGKKGSKKTYDLKKVVKLNEKSITLDEFNKLFEEK